MSSVNRGTPQHPSSDAKRYTIGIDTGGTYTDAVLLAPDQHSILAKAKALTTPADLSEGVSQALSSLVEQVNATNKGGFDLNQISRVGLSTTLATNALVEGLGSAIGVILIGFDQGMIKRSQVDQIADTQILSLSGGHRYTGEQTAQFDELALVEWLDEYPNLTAYAVASHYAVRNPEHELRAAAVIESRTRKPVSVSTALSSHLNDPARALTAALNARIIRLIEHLHTAVSDSLIALGIGAKVMVVKGDGSVVALEAIRHKPIETILSGPAASVLGAHFLIKNPNFIIADIGGTTTDIANIENGWPKLNEAGAGIGGFRTLVKAIDMRSVALGGDTEITLDHRTQLMLGKRRVIPVSLLVHRWPRLEAEIKGRLANNKGLSHAVCYLIRVDLKPTYVQSLNLLARDFSLLEKLRINEPLPYYTLIDSASTRASLNRLRDAGLVQLSGVTPSDAAHVLGLQNQWSRPAATLACAIYAEITRNADSGYERHAYDQNKATVATAQNIHELVVKASCLLLIDQLSGHPTSPEQPLVDAVINNTQQVGQLRVQLSPLVDLVAVGGPAGVYYPAVGERLNVQTLLPEHSEVANAIGAAVSLIRLQASIEVTFISFGEYRVHTEHGPEHIKGGDAAISTACEAASRAVLSDAKLMGAKSSEIEFDIQRIDLPDLQNEHRLMAATVTAKLSSDIA